ncbi:MAG: helix-turn-helix transcriptional regulator [Nitrospira sp.]|nr:MAG: helix-turn-helix transcriptional regulator [Nitrospira sp.]
MSPVGRLIQHWRRARQKSQLVLALEAGISARHLGFLEIGRAKPSREMVLILADALDVPLRERNGLLMTAGYAPFYRETGLDVQEMAHARRALELILSQQEPYPAVVMDRHWNIVMTNKAASRFFARLVALRADQRSANVIRLMFDPTGLRPFVGNWPAVAEALIHRVHREALGGVPDEETVRLLAEVLSYPGVPKSWQSPDVLGEPPTPYLAVEFRKGNFAMNFFSTVTTLGTPQDITLQEMRIECFFPADKKTEVTARQLLSD